ncbi:hypothetical protein HPB50_018988 [Hyalomma asiaticum]|uniref:Uncharacterized protein n=1 Tax=Hyalomma asiaticum TaxID=266040 RepID=A0ACB7RKR1_HYAAI|nr:hypothetical protein HPB50_018988 [Hyalomma asiaticum]
MAETFDFRNKTVATESAARRTFGRRTWLVVGLMTSAMLLMCTSVALFQRRFDLTGFFRHPPAAAAVAEDWGRQSTDNATLLKTGDGLERGQRGSSSHGRTAASEIKTLEPLQVKIKRKARAKSPSRPRQGAKESSRGTVVTVRKASSERSATQRPRDGGMDVDVDRELEILQRPFADRPRATEDDASPITRVDTTKAVPVSQSAETMPKSKARFVSSPRTRSSGASYNTQTSTSDYTGNTADSQKRTGNTTTGLPQSHVPASSTKSTKDSSVSPHRGIRMVKKRRKLRKLVKLPAQASASDSLSSSTIRAGDKSTPPQTTLTGDVQVKNEEKLPAQAPGSDSPSSSTVRAGDKSALPQTAITGDVKVKKEDLKKEHDALHNELNSTSTVATGLSSEIPAASTVHTAATDIESSKAVTGNVSPSMSSQVPSQVRSSSPPVNSVPFSKKRDLAGSSDQEPVSKQGTAVGVIGSTPNLGAASTANSFAASTLSNRPEGNSTTASSSNETDASESKKHDSSTASSSQIRTSTTTRSALRSTEPAQTPHIDDTSTDANLVDVVAGGANKSAEDVINRIFDKATKDGQNNSANSPRERSGPAETSKNVDGRVTLEADVGNASSSVAVESTYSRPSSELASSTRVRSTPYPTDQNRLTIGVEEGRNLVSTRDVALTHSSAAEPSNTQPPTIQSSKMDDLKTETLEKELATKRQATEGWSSTARPELPASSTSVSTPDKLVEVVVTSKATSSTGPPDEIIPETEALSTTSSPDETSKPQTTTATFAYYTGQDEWIPESGGRYMDAPGRYADKLKARRRGKTLQAHSVLTNNNEPVLPGGHLSHQTIQSGDASTGSTSKKPELQTTQEGTASTALPTEQPQTSKATVEAAVSDLYSSLNAAIREESKHDIEQSNEEMLDYGVVPHDTALKNQHGVLAAYNASNMPSPSPDVGNRQIGTATLSHQRHGSFGIIVTTHPHSEDPSAEGSNLSDVNPKHLAINVAHTEGVHTETFETRSKAKQDMPQTGLPLVLNEDSDGLSTNRNNALTSEQNPLVSEITTKYSQGLVENLPREDSSSAEVTSTEPRFHKGYEGSPSDKRKLEPHTETPPNVLDIDADLQEAVSPSGRNQPDTNPLADKYATVPTDGSTKRRDTTRRFEIGTDLKYGNMGQDSTSAHLVGGPMENTQSAPQPTNESTAMHSIDAVATTTGGSEFKMKSSTPNVERAGVACVYRKNHAGWASGNTSYGLDTLPYQYCASIVYCCLSLREDFAIEDQGDHSDFKHLAKIKSINRGLQTFVVIEADESTAPFFKRLMSSTVHQDIFLLFAVHWMRTRAIDGVYLYWPHMEERDADDVVRTFRYLVDSFAKSNLKFGIVVPPGMQYFAEVSTLKAMIKDLDGSYGAVLLSPPEMDESSFTGKLSTPTQALAEEYGKYPADVAGSAVCPMIPFWGKTFKMQAVLQDTGLALRPVGRGGARQTSQEPGKLAFFEFCREVGNSLFVFPSRENAMIGDEYVTFLTPATLEKYLSSALHGPWRCLGSWGPEWDDLDGRCGLGRYPLLKTLYEFHTKRAVNASAALVVSKAGLS